MRDLRILVELASAGATKEPTKFTTSKLAKVLGCSQPTVARWLLKLERDGLVERSPTPRGQKVKLTRAGVANLLDIHRKLNEVFTGAKSIELVGEVTTGLGEGSYYMSHDGYRNQFKRQLGFDPYPGTLDVKLDSRSLELRELLDQSPSNIIEGFTTPERTFGQVKWFPAKLRGIRAALIIPQRSSCREIIELVAPKNLRKTMGLKDGAKVKIEVVI